MDSRLNRGVFACWTVQSIQRVQQLIHVMSEFDAYRCQARIAHRGREGFDRLLHGLLLLGDRLAKCTRIGRVEHAQCRAPVGIRLLPPNGSTGLSHRSAREGRDAGDQPKERARGHRAPPAEVPRPMANDRARPRAILQDCSKLSGAYGLQGAGSRQWSGTTLRRVLRQDRSSCFQNFR